MKGVYAWVGEVAAWVGVGPNVVSGKRGKRCVQRGRYGVEHVKEGDMVLSAHTDPNATYDHNGDIILVDGKGENKGLRDVKPELKVEES